MVASPEVEESENVAANARDAGRDAEPPSLADCVSADASRLILTAASMRSLRLSAALFPLLSKLRLRSREKLTIMGFLGTFILSSSEAEITITSGCVKFPA